MSKLEQIMDIFKTHGKSETPVAIIQNGTTDKEKIVIGTVNDIFFKAEYEGLTNPAVVIVGEVVNLHAINTVKSSSSIATIWNNL